LTTFQEEISTLSLKPDSSGGVFDIKVDDALLWSRKDNGRFPEITELKRLVRDRIAPERTLGHVDKKADQ
jgi:selenoprotein W-related protein